MYDFLLFVHVLSAFALLGATAVFWALTLATRPGRALLAPQTAAVLAKPTTVVVIVGTLGTLVFGVWLAIYVDGYELWDGWIVAALVLWVVGTWAGSRSGKEYTASGMTSDPAESALLWKRGTLMAAISTVAVLAVLVLMIYKPGA